MKHLILIKVRTADPHVTLKFPFVSMCKKRVLANLKIKKMDQFLERLIPPCRSFLFPVFLTEFPSGVWVLTKLANFALTFKIHLRGSPRRVTLRYSSGRRWPT